MRRVNIITYDLIKECYGDLLEPHKNRKGEKANLILGSTMWQDTFTKIVLGHPLRIITITIR